MKIGLLSDTHGYFDNRFKELFKDCHEVWHGGDWGEGVAEKLEAFKPVRGVYGNIDGQFIRSKYPEKNFFIVNDLKVLMIHIGGYPNHYAPGVKDLIKQFQPGLFICGHSHILKVMPDASLNLLHINPGAAGKSGFHVMRTAIRFEIINGTVKNLEVIELGKRSSLE